MKFEKKIAEHESDGYANCNWCYWYSHQRIGTKTRRHGYNGMSGKHPNYSLTESGHNTEKSPGDLKRLVITQNPVKNNELTLM